MRNTSIRIFEKENDYEIVSGWWQGHGFPVIPAAVLPKLGVVMSIDGVDAAAGWLYMDNSVGVSMLEWLVTNPENKPRDSLVAIREIISFLKDRAVAMDYGVMLTTCKQPSLIKVLERNGFTRTDEGMYHAIASLR